MAVPNQCKNMNDANLSDKVLKMELQWFRSVTLPGATQRMPEYVLPFVCALVREREREGEGGRQGRAGMCTHRMSEKQTRQYPHSTLYSVLACLLALMKVA